MSTIDITNLSDAALEVVLASRSSEAVDAEHLTSAERWSVAEALGWQTTPLVRLWCSAPTAPRASIGDAIDYEDLIMEQQEDDGRNV